MSFQDFQNQIVGRTKPAAAQNPSQAIAGSIFQINTAVSTYRRLVDAIGTVKDTPDHRQKLQATRLRILQLVKDTSPKLKTLSESDRDSHITVHSSLLSLRMFAYFFSQFLFPVSLFYYFVYTRYTKSEEKTKKFLQPNKKIEDAKLAKDFQTVLQEFQKVQQLSSERESTYAPSGPPLPTPSVDSSSSREPTMNQDTQPFLMQQKRQELILLDNEIAFNEAIIEEREQGIKEIQEQIVEVNEIFRDLAVLVHDQGVVIDDIHSNIDSSAAATTQARVQLAKASKSTKTRTSWCWWVLGIVVVVVVVILLVVLL